MGWGRGRKDTEWKNGAKKERKCYFVCMWMQAGFIEQFVVRRYRETLELGLWSRARQGARLKSSGCLSGGRCGGVAVRLFSLSAVGRCLRQPRHTPLIILPLNTQPLAARTHVCVWLVCMWSMCPCVRKWSAQAQSSRTKHVWRSKRGWQRILLAGWKYCWSGSSRLTRVTYRHVFVCVVVRDVCACMQKCGRVWNKIKHYWLDYVISRNGQLLWLINNNSAWCLILCDSSFSIKDVIFWNI